MQVTETIDFTQLNTFMNYNTDANQIPKLPLKTQIVKKEKDSAAGSGFAKKGLLPVIEGGNFIKHVFKKGGKNHGQLILEDLDESVLKKKLESLTNELNEYKERCAKFKKENLWYQQEIELANKDNAEYISYLESKKEQKLVAIQALAEGNKGDQEGFLEKKKMYKEEYEKKIAELQDSISELEVKLNGKEEEFHQLSDTMLKRAKHYEDIQKIRDEIKASEQKNNSLIATLEKQLLDARIALQIQTDAQVKQLQEKAQERAAQYLTSHTTSITLENKELETILQSLTLCTHRLVLRRDCIGKAVEEMERQVSLRDDLIAIRAGRIGAAIMRRDKESRRKKERVARWRRDVVEGRLKGNKVLDEMPDDWMDDASDD